MPRRHPRRFPEPKSRRPIERKYARAIVRAVVEPMISAVRRHVLPVLAELDRSDAEHADEQDEDSRPNRSVSIAKHDASLRTSQASLRGAARTSLAETHNLEASQLELLVGRTVKPKSKRARKEGQRAIIDLGVDPFGSEPWLNHAMAEAVERNVRLIRTIPARHFEEIAEIVSAGVRSGLQGSVISAKILGRFGVARSRAELIAADQVGKFYSSLDDRRMRALGVEAYYWRTSKDERVRPEHEARDGILFQMDDPPPDGHPGEPVRCRCYREPVIPGLEESED